MRLLRPARLLDDESEMHVVPLMVILTKELGPNFVFWESDALREELEARHGEIGIIAWERIQAGRVMVVNSAFWREWEVFEKCTAAIIGESPVFSYVQPPESEEVAVALRAASSIASYTYSDEVRRYICAACLTDGLWNFEPPLDVANEVLLDHDRKKGVKRDHDSVIRVLSQTDDYIQNPSNAAEVQANNVISVRKAVAEYDEQVIAQLKEAGMV